MAEALTLRPSAGVDRLRRGGRARGAARSCRAAADRGRRRRTRRGGAQGERRPRRRPDGRRARLPWTDAETTQALQKLLDDPATTAAALPIVAKWDKAGVLSAKADGHAQLMLRDLGDAATSDERRVDSAASLLAVPARRAAGALRDCADAVRPRGAGAAQGPPDRRARRDGGQRCGCRADRGAGAHQLDAAVRSAPEASGFLARAAGRDERREQSRRRTSGPPTSRGCARIRTGRWRCRPPRSSTRCRRPRRRRATSSRRCCRRSRSPATRAKGKVLFTGACSSCHKLGDLGKSEAGPPLNGMGAHGRAELLGHIVDPNREVDPSFWQWNVTTRKGETLAGVIASENAASLTLRSADRRRGDQEGRHRDAREHAPLAHARGARGARRRGAARHPQRSWPAMATTRSSASSICVRPTRRTAAAGSAAKRSATRR